MTGTCSRTSAVLALLDSAGDPDLALADHAIECEVCRAAIALESGELDLLRTASTADEPNAAFLERLSGAVIGRRNTDRERTPDRPEIPGFEVFEQIGHGGTANVYRARQIYLDRIVALKVLRSEQMLGPHDLLRSRRGVSALAAVRHPNVIQVYEVGRKGGEFYAALEFAERGSLASRLTGEPWPATEAAKFVIALARGVAAIHAAGFVHRDLKPGNVLLGPHGQPKVADFGLARSIQGDDAITTGTFIGTPAAMAPEQAAGQIVGPSADVHALGGILYELLTGRAPFRGENTVETIARVQSQIPPVPSSLVVQIPREIERICLWCLAKNPADRCPSAVVLANSLSAAIAPRSVAWRSPTHTVLSALGLVSLAGFIVSGWYHAAEARRTAEITHDVVRLSAASRNLDAGDDVGAREHLAAIPESRRTPEWRRLRERLGP